jgi:heavy metal efflux system protein
LCEIKLEDGASTIYREGNSALHRHQVQRARTRPGQHGAQAIEEVHQKVQLPEGYHLDWTGEYESQQRANRRWPSSCPSRFC